jgi:hypothetical protein
MVNSVGPRSCKLQQPLTFGLKAAPFADADGASTKSAAGDADREATAASPSAPAVAGAAAPGSSVRARLDELSIFMILCGNNANIRRTNQESFSFLGSLLVFWGHPLRMHVSFLGSILSSKVSILGSHHGV